MSARRQEEAMISIEYLLAMQGPFRSSSGGSMTTRHDPIASDFAPTLARSGSRTTLVASALALSAAAVTAVLIWHPWPARDQFEYGDIAPIRDAMWAAIVIDALGFAVVGITLSIVVCMLARSRGAVFASVGAVITTLGGIGLAMGEFGFAAMSWYSTEADAISVAEGTKLLDYTVDHPEHGMVVQMAGFLLFTVGTILLLVALIRSRSVPLWLPIACLVLIVAQFTPVPGRVLDFVQVGSMALFVALAWMFHRGTSTR
jgi:hypothetical protein